jgi:predicted TIM-barrel fold metal-dependent hydrolase
LPWPVPQLARFGWFRTFFYRLSRFGLFVRFANVVPHLGDRTVRYAEILDTSYAAKQDEVFDIVRRSYPVGTCFVVLPMDMTQMNAGRVPCSIAEQHQQLAELSKSNKGIVAPFVAVDPRHADAVDPRDRFDIVKATIDLIEDGFCGIKLYPPTGYHPFDERLHPLYDYANERKIPVLSHCSRPASVQYRGTPAPEMRMDPENPGRRLDYNRFNLLTYFTRPDAYLPILRRWTALPVCLAHFGGAGDWDNYINKPWQPPADPVLGTNWLERILELIRSGDYPNLWTDISYTLFANNDFVYGLKLLLQEQRVLDHVMFGSDFYVVENATLKERERAIRIRAILGDTVFQTIAEANPRRFLGPRCSLP